MSLPAISDEQSRARMLRQHRLIAETRADTPEAVAGSVIGLHATTASTVYLSTWARMHTFDVTDLERVLYTDRTLVRQLAMRRALVVFPRPALADAVSVVGTRVASTTELRKELPALDGVIPHGEGKAWSGVASMGPRVLSHMSAAGEIMSGPNDGNWLRSKPRWTSMSDWLGQPLPIADPETGYRELIRRWLRQFGPGTETDIVWRLGSIKGAAGKAIAQLDAIEVALGGGLVGYVMPDDLEPVESPSETRLSGTDPQDARRLTLDTGKFQASEGKYPSAISQMPVFRA